MPEIEVDIEIFCSCGKGICNNATSGRTNSRRQPYFTIEPCKDCLEAAKQEGYDEGYKDRKEAVS